MAEEKKFDFTVKATITATFIAKSEAAARERFAEFLDQVNAADHLQAGESGFYVAVEQGEEPDVTEVCTKHQEQMMLGYCMQCHKEEKRKRGAKRR